MIPRLFLSLSHSLGVRRYSASRPTVVAANADSLLRSVLLDFPDVKDHVVLAQRARDRLVEVCRLSDADRCLLVSKPDVGRAPSWALKRPMHADPIFDLRQVTKAAFNPVLKEFTKLVRPGLLLSHSDAAHGDTILHNLLRTSFPLNFRVVLASGDRALRFVSRDTSLYHFGRKCLVDADSFFNHYHVPVSRIHELLALQSVVDASMEQTADFLLTSCSIDELYQKVLSRSTSLELADKLKQVYGRLTDSALPFFDCVVDIGMVAPESSSLLSLSTLSSCVSASVSAATANRTLALEDPHEDLSEDDIEPLVEIANEVSETRTSEFFSDHRIVSVCSDKDLAMFEKDIQRCSSVFVYPLCFEVNNFEEQIVGFAVCGDMSSTAYYIPYHVNESTGFFTPEAFQQRHNVLLSLLMSSRTKKVVHDAKRVMRQFQGSKLSLANFDDIMVQSYVLNCGLHPHDLDALLEVHFPTANFLTLKSVTGSGKKKLALCDPRIVSEAAVFASSRVIAIKTIWNKLSKQLTSVASTQLLQLYETIERPLVSVLRGMEHHGVLISREDLEVLQRRYAEAIVKKAHEVQESCGAFDINIQSPSQIQRKLRELGLLDESVTSTDAKVLEQLGTHHPFPRKLLEYRALVKIQGTYVEGLLPHINPSTGRIHTTFQNALTNTGRLSSVHPNLQNIPVRTEEGREIRRCFMAPERWKLLSCDYSQVELRILAHISQDKVLQDAFRNNKDVHSITASQVFKVPESSVTKDLRRKAKAINFGIVYGMTEVGLSAQLDVSREEAAQYIRDYKNTYPGITEYMTQMQSHCSQHGYVSTMLGRRCHIPAIHDKRNRGMYNFALRAAINSPIQGTSADITKLAMLEVDRMFRSKQVRSRMILQIHDELMFECPDEEVDAVWPIIRQCMEGVGDRLQFSVPLTVGQSVSQRWEDK